MSGIEAAGIVLGAIPLLISGLQHYGRGASTIKDIFGARAECRSLARKLAVEKDILQNTVELLLGDSVDDALLEDLWTNIGGSSWSAPTIDAALRKRLARSRQRFLETLDAMNRTLQSLGARLQLGDDPKQTAFRDANAFLQACKQVKFGIMKAEYVAVIDEITKGNTTLRTITEQSRVLEPARELRRRIPNFAKARSQACSVFVSLQRGMRTTCRASHRASVCMKPLELESGPVSCDDDSAFRVILSHDPQEVSHLPSPWMIAEAEFRILKGGLELQSNATCMGTSLPVRSKGKKIVRVQEPPKAPQAPSPAASMATHQPTLSEIRDLCESIQSLRASRGGVCLGYLQSHADDQRHGLYCPEEPLVGQNTISSVSLRSLLEDSSSGSSSTLSVSDSRKLAHSLALGVLRLYDSPWLDTQWKGDDIHLLGGKNRLLAEHPFVSTDLQRRAQSAGPRICPAIRNQTLFALGIVLIELCLRTKFDSLLLPEDLGVDGAKHVASDFLAAIRLIDQVYDTAGKRYGDAVRRCILCEFDRHNTSLEDDLFRKAVYINVVSVLEEDVEQFCGL